jgi:hypothetical protein
MYALEDFEVLNDFQLQNTEKKYHSTSSASVRSKSRSCEVTQILRFAIAELAKILISTANARVNIYFTFPK